MAIQALRFATEEQHQSLASTKGATGYLLQMPVLQIASVYFRSRWASQYGQWLLSLVYESYESSVTLIVTKGGGGSTRVT